MRRIPFIIYILLFVSGLFILYSLGAYYVMPQIIRYEGALWWRTTPAGSLFPIPHGSGMLQALSKVSPLDIFIYDILKSGALVAVDIVLVAVLIFITYRWFR